MTVMDALARGSDSSATTAAKNYNNYSYALPFLWSKLIVIGKCTIWRQKLLFISFFEMYQLHAHLLRNGTRAGGGGRPLSEMPT